MMDSSTPISWSLLKTFSWDCPPRVVLGRSPKTDRDYSEYSALLNGEGRSSYQSIMDEYFSNGNKYILAFNKFPYFLETGIRHYVVWINPRLRIINDDNITENERQDIEQLLCSRLYKGDREKMKRECVYFQNIAALRSVKGIPHTQSFSLTSPRIGD